MGIDFASEFDGLRCLRFIQLIYKLIVERFSFNLTRSDHINSYWT